MDLRMLGFRLTPRPFWFEDLMFSIVDETRRLPARVAYARERIRRLASKASALDPTELLRSKAEPQPVAALAPPRREVIPLAEEEAWWLATEPLTAARTTTYSAAAMHSAAAEQLDSLTYALDRMREELRPLMTYAPLKDDTVEPLRVESQLETSIEALLELSKLCEATRPKDRARSAA